MDVSPRALRAVTFREKLRGYHPDDVDQFLERVAEGVAALQGKLDDAIARAEKAELETSGLSEGEEAVRRTLSLAQRTADLALKEAKEEATRLVADARATAERVSDEAQRHLRADLERLESARKHLHADVLAMQQYVENERVRVRNALAELVRKVDASARKPPAPPQPTPIDVPPTRRVVVEETLERAPEPPQSPQQQPEPLPAPPPAPEPVVVAEPEPVAAAEPEAPVPEPAPDFDEPEVAPIRREPQPPPVAGARFAQARPAAGRPSGPPPGPRRLAASMSPPGEPAENNDETDDDAEGKASVRRLFGR